jgi:serine/threonine protein kinase
LIFGTSAISFFSLSFFFSFSNLKKKLIEKKKMDFIVSSKILGFGSFAFVKQARRRSTGELVADKVFVTKGKLIQEWRVIENEIRIWQNLKHPNIIGILDVYRATTHTHIFMPIMQGKDLYMWLERYKKCTEAQASNVFIQLARAVQYCHQRNIVHRDIKAENILLECPGENIGSTRICLGDFGLSATQREDGDPFYDHVGSPITAAPELVKKMPYFGRHCDIWSMGIVLFFMLKGSYPFDGSCYEELFHKIVHDDAFLSMNKFSENVCVLVTEMLNKSPQRRPSINEVLVHPWCTHFLDHPDREDAGSPVASISPTELLSSIV